MARQFAVSHAAWIGGGVAALAAAVLATSCGGGGGDEPGPAVQATLDATSVGKAVADLSPFVPVCQPATGGRSDPMAAASTPVTRLMSALARQRHPGTLRAPTQRPLAYTSTVPADTLGDCGGRFGYPTYSHDSGVTTAVLQFSDYCTSDAGTGLQTVINGRLSFVNTATPTAAGPITTKWEGSTTGLTAVGRTATGSVASSETVSFDKLSYTVGVPGGVPTAASPDRLAAAEFRIANNLTSKAYRQTNYQITSFQTASGGEQMSLSGRGYRSDGSYFDIATPSPLVLDANGISVSGSISFSGANGNSAVATLVPGGPLQFTMTVNGTALTGLPTCTK